jgi:hypothetical protein
MSYQMETGEVLVWATGVVCEGEVYQMEGAEEYAVFRVQQFCTPLYRVPNTARADVQLKRSDGTVCSYRWMDVDEVPLPRLGSWDDLETVSAWLREMVAWMSQSRAEREEAR